jgi:hypothetical protein
MTRYILERFPLENSKLYGCDRLMCPSFDAWQAFRKDLPPIHEKWTFTHLNAFPVGSRICKYNDPDHWVAIGFLQLWHPWGSGIYEYPREHGAADRTDVLLAQMFTRNRRELLPEIVVVHLESEIVPMGANWYGRKTVPFGPPLVKLRKPRRWRLIRLGAKRTQRFWRMLWLRLLCCRIGYCGKRPAGN